MNDDELTSPPSFDAPSDDAKMDLLMMAQFLHALKTSLQSALTCVHLLRRNDPHPLQRIEYLEAILGGILNQTRNLELVTVTSRILPDKHRIKIDAKRCLEIAQECVNGAAKLYSAQGANIGSSIDEASFSSASAASFLGRPNLIENALYNLVENAFKYSKPLSTVRVDMQADASHLCISVYNTGLRLSPEDASNAIRRGWRGREAEVVSGGTGEGLWIASRIAEQHGGYVRLHPTVNGVTQASLVITLK